MSGEKLISSNSSAKADYLIQEVVEAGIVLTGTEIKSLRNQSPNIKDSFVEIYSDRSSKKLEAYLVQSHIPPYSHGNIYNHEPLRKRKLLLHRHQIEKLFGAITQKGITVVPMRLYFKEGLVKVELGLGKGKKRGDKRNEVKKRSAEREMDQARKQRQRHSS